MAKKEQTYKQAIVELEGILEKMQHTAVDIDQLEKDIKRAAELIQFCKEKLRSTEERVSGLLDEEFS